MGGNFEGNDFSFYSNYSFGNSENFYKIGYFNRSSIFGGVSSKYGRVFNAIDFSIGRRFQSEWFGLNVWGGPAYLFGKRNLDYKKDIYFNTVGLGLETKLLFRVADEIGIGVCLYSNLNFEKSYYGYNFTVTLGNGL